MTRMCEAATGAGEKSESMFGLKIPILLANIVKGRMSSFVPRRVSCALSGKAVPAARPAYKPEGPQGSSAMRRPAEKPRQNSHEKGLAKVRSCDMGGSFS